MTGAEARGDMHDLAWWSCCSLWEEPAVALQMMNFWQCLQTPGQAFLMCATMRSEAECWSGAERRSAQVVQTMLQTMYLGSGSGGETEAEDDLPALEERTRHCDLW